MNGIPLPPVPQREYLATMEQLADARLFAAQEGPARGERLVVVDNGSGLYFTVTPDRGMDLVECRFRGIPVAFRTPVGYSGAGRFEPSGIGWLRNWQGGLLTTAGLRNAGVPNGESGLHGRASNLSAQDFGIRRGLTAENRYELKLFGELREAAMFGENLRWQRTISTAYGENIITIRDRVTNLAPHEDAVQLLYHCNFGYPLAAPDLVFEQADDGHAVTPRNEHAARHLANWRRLEPPTPDYAEVCYFHKLIPQTDKLVRFGVCNPALGIRLELRFDPAELPNFVEWKNCLSGSYALGLEPCNVSLSGRTADLADGTARKIAPYETIEFSLQIAFETI